MKIAIAQITTHPGRIKENTDKILSWIENAKSQNADIVVFPELTIPGYTAMDLFLNDSYIEENVEALRAITKATKGIKAIVGFVDVDRQRIRPDKKLIRYNTAALIDDGKILALRDKTLLPEYDIFMEKRYFAASRQRGLLDLFDMKIGLQICEDIYSWGYPVNVTEEYLEGGMELLINISASPFSVGKRKTRFDWINLATKSRKVPVVYVNTVGSYDGYEGEIVFDGRSFILNENGVLVAQAKAFEEDLVVVDMPNDKLLVHYEDNDIRDVYNALVLGIKSYAERCGFKRACLGISGGIDSAIVAALSVDAFGADAVTLISMPSQYSSEATRVDAKRVAKSLKTKFLEISIQPLFEAYQSELGPKIYNEAPQENDATYENIQSRIRGNILMAYSNRTGALLFNTGNKTELALGYCTLYGDMNGAISPLGDISKTRIYELANYINRRSEVIPTSIIERPPSAELKPDQTDEQGLGAPYSILSPLVDEIVEQDSEFDDLKKRYPADVIEGVQKRIKLNEFKRRQAPPSIRITDKAFGLGRRIPISY